MKTTKLIFFFFLIGISGCATRPETLPATNTLLPSRPSSTNTPVPTMTPAPTFTPDPNFLPFLQIFEYDTDLDLEVTWGTETQGEEFSLQQVTYLGANDCTVRAYLLTPQGNGPFPALIFMHMGQSNKDQFLEEAKLLAGSGVVSILLDSPFRRRCVDDENPREGYIGTVVDVRRAIDLMETLEFVDLNRIGYVGHSFGGTWGGVLAGVEPRIKAFVLVAGTSQVSVLEAPYDADLDAAHYVGHSQASILFQFSINDEWITLDDANLYYDSAQYRKEILWYDSTHRDLQFVGQEDRLEWLAEQFGFEVP